MTGRIRVKRLKDHRSARRLTQLELAHLAGVSIPTIRRGERNLTVYAASVRRLAEALQVEPEALT